MVLGYVLVYFLFVVKLFRLALIKEPEKIVPALRIGQIHYSSGGLQPQMHRASGILAIALALAHINIIHSLFLRIIFNLNCSI